MSGARPQFYNKTIRSYVVTFGNLFNEISIQREDDTDTAIKTIEVPIAFAPKEKFIVRLNQDSSIDTDGTKVQITLPRLGFNLVGMSPDPGRKLNTLQKRIICEGNDPDNIKYQFQPVPYNFDFELYIFTRNYDDGMQIIEQILPFFTPYINVSIQDNRNFSDFVDIPLTFNSIGSQEEFEGNFDARRALIWTLNFTFAGYLYGETKTSGLIKNSQVNITDGDTCGPLQKITVEPDPLTAGPEDDFGFNITIEDFDK